jgi:ribosomal protein L12E/L44/L45/RPP1/RPP2
LVRAATLLVAPELAAALRDQPVVEEAIAWAAVASAVADAAVEAAVAAGAEAADKKLWRKKRNENEITC